MSDTLMIEATGQSVERLTATLALCGSWEGDEAAFYGWGEHENGICFPAHGGTKFPVPINARQAAEIAFEFIDKLPREKWPQQPDIDGDCKRGWKVVRGWDGTVIVPFWMIFHK